MILEIYYGTDSKFKNVTETAKHKLLENGQIIIPKEDAARSSIFGDPAVGSEKHIRVKTADGVKTYDYTTDIVIDVSEAIKYKDMRDRWQSEFLRTIDPVTQLNQLHKELVITGGNIKDEYPEQLLI